MRLFAVITVSSAILAVSSNPNQHSTFVQRDLSSCDAQTIHDHCAGKTQQSGTSSQSFEGCIAEAERSCANTPRSTRKRTGSPCPAARASCEQKLGLSATSDAITQCVRNLNPSCSDQSKSNVPSTKREECDFDTLHSCVQKAGPEGMSDVYPCLFDFLGTCCENIPMFQSPRRRSDNSPMKRDGSITSDGDDNAAAPASKREDSDPLGVITPCAEAARLISQGGGSEPVSLPSTSNSNEPDPVSPLVASVGKSAGNLVAPADRREENYPDPVGSLSTGAATLLPGDADDDMTMPANKRANISPVKREDDDSSVIPLISTLASDDTINKRVMIKREDENPLASCVALVGPGGMSGPAKRLVEPVKRDDCDVQAFEEACLDDLGLDVDCALLIQCFNNLAQDCGRQSQAKRAESVCDFAVIDHACAIQLGPDATGRAMSKCIQDGLKSSPACANNIQFGPPNHKRDDLACNIESLARACHTKRGSMVEYFGCVSAMAVSMSGCEHKLLNAMDAS